jgi:NhaP-type Na+/H+ and K+/H+ antiporter
VIYVATRNWVDRVLRWDGVRARVVVLPAILPALAGLPFGNGPIVTTVVATWFVVWSLFVSWRYWLYMREMSVEADKNYDRVGKYSLAKEYHGTESATAARARKTKNG